MVVDYKSRKNEVLASYETAEKLVSELQAYAASIKLPDPTERLAALLSDIRSKAEKVRADRFSIMVAGESKSGKSTFINAYLGVDLLPMDVKQCTSAILEIKYAIKEKQLKNEQILVIIQDLVKAAERLNDARIEVDRIKGGIGQYVQRKD